MLRLRQKYTFQIHVTGAVILCHFAAFGQSDSASNLVSYADKILVKSNLSTQIDQYVLNVSNRPGLQLQSNNELKYFLSLDYEFIGISYGFSPKLFRINNDSNLKGKSSFTNYKLQCFPGKWLQTAELDLVKGFYVVNTGDFVPNWQKGVNPYLQIPTLKSVRLAFSTSYIFNSNFSFKNLAFQTEWQKRSAGSLIPSLAYDLTKTEFDEFAVKSKQRDLNLRIGIGYYHTFIIGTKFFFSPNLVPSVGIRFSRSISNVVGATGPAHDKYFTYFLESGLKLGFDSKKFVAGAGLNFNFNWFKQDASSRVYNDRLFGLAYVGYRFNQPKILKSTYRKFLELLPM